MREVIFQGIVVENDLIEDQIPDTDLVHAQDAVLVRTIDAREENMIEAEAKAVIPAALDIERSQIVKPHRIHLLNDDPILEMRSDQITGVLLNPPISIDRIPQIEKSQLVTECLNLQFDRGLVPEMQETQSVEVHLIRQFINDQILEVKET